MGQIIIEIPQNGTYIYHFQDAARAEKLLADLDAIAMAERAEEDEDILGIWSEPEPIKRAAKQ